jgi:DNA helicase-2/ATP-dependent DNA helicase PcrA
VTKPNLNPEQLAVVQHDKGPLRVGAVAGSGKTTALVERVAHLIEVRKVPIDRILLISFSRVARDEMKRRLGKRLPGLSAGGCARTFHSIGLNIFKREADPNQEFEMDTSGIMYLKATEKAYRSMHIEPEKKAIIHFASLVKNNLLGTDEVLRRLGRVDPRMLKIAQDCVGEAKVSAPDLLQAFYRAERIRSVEGIEHRNERVRFVGFDDMIYQSAMLLKKKEVRERWAGRWDHVLQDECQDENEAQAAIAGALCSRTRNYVIVGDPAQSIYGWRGSKPEKMLAFEEDWPGAKTVVMHRNYRSGLEIVELANRIMGFMPGGTVITDEIGDAQMMVSERKTHSYVGAHVFEDSVEEANRVADNIREHKRNGVPYSEQAVLLRMNRMTRDIEISLATKGIPYRLLSGQSFFLMKEAQVLFGYLRVMLNRADEAAFKACVMNPTRKLGNAFIKKVAAGHDMVKKDWLASVDKAMPGLGTFQKKMASQWVRWMRNERVMLKPTQDPEPVLRQLRDRLKLDDHFARNEQDQEDSKSIENLDAVCEFAKHFGSCAELLDTVERVERHRALHNRKKEAVTISTVHKAKGAEWQVVYVIQVIGGFFPADKADLHEERRCFYVACTRAKDEVWISRPAMHEGEPVSMSRFILEAELEEQHASILGYRLGRATDQVKVGTQMGLL